jgi:uncharacterized protein YecE (DUF72 family)
MWSLPEWSGRFLPTEGTDTLTAYASWCNAVEGNTTFYAVPAATTVAAWSQHAPPDFRFCFKLPRTITHDRRLRGVGDELNDFLMAMEPIADRCGPMMIQLPPTFGPDDLPALTTFLGSLPRLDWSWAVEVRHHAFFPGGRSERPLNDTLAEHRVNRVLLDSRPLFAGPCRTPAEIDAFARKPRVPVRPVATASSPVVRLIGRTDPVATRAGWQQWVPKVADWLTAGLQPYVFVHTPDNMDSLWLNREFHAEVAALVAAGVVGDPAAPVVEPLPDPMEPIRQLDLF